MQGCDHTKLIWLSRFDRDPHHNRICLTLLSPFPVYLLSKSPIYVGLVQDRLPIIDVDNDTRHLVVLIIVFYISLYFRIASTTIIIIIPDNIPLFRTKHLATKQPNSQRNINCYIYVVLESLVLVSNILSSQEQPSSCLPCISILSTITIYYPYNNLFDQYLFHAATTTSI